jgi:hypothetical protein
MGRPTLDHLELGIEKCRLRSRASLSLARGRLQAALAEEISLFSLL